MYFYFPQKLFNVIKHFSYGQDQGYPSEQQFVAKQEDEEVGLIDRLFFPANRFGIPLPLAIILFLVDIVVSGNWKQNISKLLASICAFEFLNCILADLSRIFVIS